MGEILLKILPVWLFQSFPSFSKGKLDENTDRILQHSILARSCVNAYKYNEKNWAVFSRGVKRALINLSSMKNRVLSGLPRNYSTL